MAAEPIHVEAEDEVPVVIERIRRSASDEVHLVLPPRARLGQSRFNFQLLKQYSTRLGKRVAIWSPDPAVQRLAEESGFGSLRPEANGPGGPNGPSNPFRRPAAPRPEALPARAPGPAAPPGPRPGVRAAVPGAPAAVPGAPAAVPGVTAAVPGSSPSRLGSMGRIARTGQPALTRIRIGAPRRMPSLTQYEPARYALYAGAVLVLLAGIVAVLFEVPSATVTLVAQAQPFSTSVDVTADPSKPLPVRVRPASLTQSLSVAGQATGTKVTSGQLATGQFTYVNSCQGQAFVLQTNQYLMSVTGMAFYQTSGDVVIQPNEQKTVQVRATQAGTAGNVGAGQINAIEHNQNPCLTGTNQQPTSGGTDDQKQTVIQSSDIQSAKVKLEQSLRQQMLTDLQRGIRQGETLANQPIFTNEQFSTTHNVDENYPNFTATLALTAEGDYYFADDVAKVFTDRLAAKVPKDQQLTTNKVTPSYTVTASSGGHLDFSGTASGYIAPRIDIASIKRQLAGKPAAQAHDVLTRLPIQRSDISQSPPLPLLPLSASRIYIDYGVQAGPATSST